MKLEKLNKTELNKMRKYADVYRELLAQRGVYIADGSPYAFIIFDKESGYPKYSAKEFLENLDYEYLTALIDEAIAEDPNYELLVEYVLEEISDPADKTIENDYCLDLLPQKYYGYVVSKRMEALNACK